MYEKLKRLLYRWTDHRVSNSLSVFSHFPKSFKPGCTFLSSEVLKRVTYVPFATVTPAPRKASPLKIVYEERVAPMAMIFHKPGLRKLIYKASTNAEYLDRESEAVLLLHTSQLSPA